MRRSSAPARMMIARVMMEGAAGAIGAVTGGVGGAHMFPFLKETQGTWFDTFKGPARVHCGAGIRCQPFARWAGAGWLASRMMYAIGLARGSTGACR